MTYDIKSLYISLLDISLFLLKIRNNICQWDKKNNVPFELSLFLWLHRQIFFFFLE